MAFEKGLIRQFAKACLRREMKDKGPKTKHWGGSVCGKSLAGKEPLLRKKKDQLMPYSSLRAKGTLRIGAPKELDKGAWRNPWIGKLTPTSAVYPKEACLNTTHQKTIA